MSVSPEMEVALFDVTEVSSNMVNAATAIEDLIKPSEYVGSVVVSVLIMREIATMLRQAAAMQEQLVDAIQKAGHYP